MGTKIRIKVDKWDDIYNLDEGQVIFQAPSRISKDSLEEFEYYWKMVLNRARRSVRKTPMEELVDGLDDFADRVYGPSELPEIKGE